MPKIPAPRTMIFRSVLPGLLLFGWLAAARADAPGRWGGLAPCFSAPAGLDGDFGPYRSPLVFDDGRRVRSRSQWPARRREILAAWQAILGPWPPLLEKPRLEFLSRTNRENFAQYRVRVEIAAGQMLDGYLLVPQPAGRRPAVVVPYYEPETSIGLGQQPLRDFAYQLARRGFVTLAIGSPGNDARKPPAGVAECQPLSFLAYVAANCLNALATLEAVDARRIGIVGHSYGGKWAMFASCLYDRFACAAWCDPGIVFDESRPNVNYWEPWYLGREPGRERKPGVPAPGNPRTGAYATLIESGHDLHELHALMAPRPFWVAGGAEDPPLRWRALNHAAAVNRLLGYSDRVGMGNRPAHAPTVESNEQIYQFFERALR